MIFLLLAGLLCLAGNISAETATQSDWSGGPGVTGPVLNWGNAFGLSSDIDFSDLPGELSLPWGKLTDVSTSIPGSAQYGIHTSTGDVDGDGDLDVLSASSIDNLITWWENLDGEGTSWSSHTVASGFEGAWGAECCDIDKDGDNDIFGSAMTADMVVWWENDGSDTSWTEHIIDGSMDGAKAIFISDMNNDGESDLLVAAKGADEVAWYRNGGSGSSWQKYSIATGYDGALSVIGCDIDLDGDIDALSAAKIDDAIRWYENENGIGTSWTEHSVVEGFDYARTAEAADIDGDGDIDVAGTGGKSKDSFGEVTWWENADSAGTAWIEHEIDPAFHGPYTILTDDIDDDGDPDVFSGSLTSNDICWWENNGNGSSWNKHKIGSLYAPLTICMADINGDGLTEIIAGSLYSFDICWWKILGYQPAGELVSSIYDTRGDSDWGELSWLAELPEGTSAGVSMRSSWDSQDLGEWSDTVFTSPVDLSGLLSDGDRFVQYGIVLRSADCDTTPHMQELSITWNSLSVEPDATGNIQPLRILNGNPACGVVEISCYLESPDDAGLSIYDLSGRIVLSTEERSEMKSGENIVYLYGLSDGIYFARLDVSGDRYTERFTVLN